MEWNRRVLELILTDLQKISYFRVDLLGFSLMYQRLEGKFAYLDLYSVQFILEQQER